MKGEKILVCGVNWLGDAVMSTPALLRLREARPQAHISILTHEKLADLWKHHPAIDEAIPFTTDESLLNIAARLRLGHFQTGLALPNSPRSALELFLGKIPERIGYARPWRNLFLTKRIRPRSEEIEMQKRSLGEIKSLILSNAPPRKQVPPSAHHIHQYLHLVAEAFGANPEPVAPRLEIASDEIVAAYRRFDLGSDLKWLGINPGAEYGPAKRWPSDRFITVAREILCQPDWGIVFFGGEADRDLVNEMIGELRRRMGGSNTNRIRDLSGRTSLRQLCVTMKMCRIVLTNDTGPMHIAAAVGTPVVVPFGSTCPGLTSPGLPGATTHQFLVSDAPCSPCFLRECPIDFRCMNGITPERVLAGIRETTK